MLQKEKGKREINDDSSMKVIKRQHDNQEKYEGNICDHL